MKFRVKLEKDGGFTLPPEPVELLFLQEGDTLLLTPEENRLVLQSQRQVTQSIQAKSTGLLDGAVEELIDERRAEAERE